MARVPLDATRPESFLNLAGKISDSMETDYVATIGLAHWAGQSSSWYDDLRRCTRYTPALGKLVTLSTFFRESAHGGHLDRFDSDQYQSPYLAQSVAASDPRPIGKFVDYWRRHLQARYADALQCQAALLGGRPPVPSESRSDLETAIDGSVDSESLHEVDAEQLDEQLGEITRVATETLAKLLVPASSSGDVAVLVLNPSGLVRRVGLELPGDLRPQVRGPIYAADQSNGHSYVVLDVPSAGYAVIDNSGPRKTATTALAEAGVLRNEFLEAHFDEQTGALRAIYDFRTRGNRVSQQLAIRLPTAPNQAAYSQMRCDSLEVSVANSALGELTVRGRLVDDSEQLLANYIQRFRLWRGSRVLINDVEIELLQELEAHPWKSYVASRLAWPDEASDLFRDVNLVRQKTESKRIEAPLFVEIETDDTRTTLLAGGMPYHQRVGLRKLDTLLMVKGESSRRFRLGIAVDLKHSVHEALALLAPLPTQSLVPDDTAQASGWLVHVDARSVVVTNWDPVFAAGKEGADEHACVGFRVRLLETAGKSGPVTLTAFRKIVAAREVDFRGEHLADCFVADGKARIDMSPFQWSEVECNW
jgi:alpha-mannosidase